MPRYPITRVEQLVGSGVTGAVWGAVRAVLKRNSPDDPYCVANELICGHIGRSLGLPVPPCGLFVDSRSPIPCFGTVNFNLNGVQPAPADPAECLRRYADVAHPRPDVVTGTLLFDILVANGDRHVRNLALDTSVSPAQLHVFDHSWAMFGRDAGKGVARLHHLHDELGVSETSSASGNRHCLLDAVRTNERFPPWLDRIRRVPDYVFRDAVEEVSQAGLIVGGEAIAAVNFLQYRRDHLSGIIERHRKEFTAIPDAAWGPLA